MSDHLPECQRWFTDMPEPDECPACEMFRACEQRVRDELFPLRWNRAEQLERARVNGWHAGWNAALEDGYAAGLDAALEAVERCRTDLRGYLDKTDALATIDALRQGEQ